MTIAGFSRQPRSNLFCLAAVILTATMFGLTYSLSASLIALNLAARGADALIIGANAGMHAIGVLFTALFLPRIVVHWGVRRMVVMALCGASLVLVAIWAAPAIWMWFPLRLMLGFASEVLFVLSEAWTNGLSREETRARAMATYTAALSIGFASGPLILSFVGAEGFIPFGVGAGIALVAALLIASPKIVAPQFDQPPREGLSHFMRLAPIAMSSTVLYAGIEAAGLSFLAIYAVNLGWPENDATRLMAVMMAGAILLQLPIGWLGDKMDRVRLLTGLATVAAVGAFLWPLALANDVATYALLFVWGGAFVGIYTIMLSIVGSRYKGTTLIGIYGGMGLMWGVGALIGPLLAGAAMQAFTHGLAYFGGVACTTFAIFVMMRGKRTS